MDNNYSIYLINFDKKYYKILYKYINNLKEADLLAQYVMANKEFDEIVYICAGGNRGIKYNNELYKEAEKIVKKYEIDYCNESFSFYD